MRRTTAGRRSRRRPAAARRTGHTGTRRSRTPAAGGRPSGPCAAARTGERLDIGSGSIAVGRPEGRHDRGAGVGGAEIRGLSAPAAAATAAIVLGSPPSSHRRSAIGRIGREDAVIDGQVDPRSRCERSEAGDRGVACIACTSRLKSRPARADTQASPALAPVLDRPAARPDRAAREGPRARGGRGRRAAAGQPRSGVPPAQPLRADPGARGRRPRDLRVGRHPRVPRRAIPRAAAPPDRPRRACPHPTVHAVERRLLRRAVGGLDGDRRGAGAAGRSRCAPPRARRHRAPSRRAGASPRRSRLAGRSDTARTRTPTCMRPFGVDTGSIGTGTTVSRAERPSLVRGAAQPGAHHTT
jgi:hypothetical protein